MKKRMFEPVEIGKIQANARIVRSATYELTAGENGVITPFLSEIYEDLINGGCDIIITGMMSIGTNACINESMIRVPDPTFLDRFGAVARKVHQMGGHVVVQLSHCGVKATLLDKGDQPYAPSDYTFYPNLPAKAITKEEIDSLVTQYAASALKCKEAGADGVQIHSAHGYLLSQFLSPHFNKRTDEYGGTIENRAHMLFQVCDAIRAAVGPNYPLWVKINYTDLIDDGLTGDDCLWVCKELEKRSVNAIEISSGIGLNRASGPAKTIVTPEDEGSYVEGALKIAEQVQISILSVGGFRTPEIIEQKLNQGNIAAISISRPLICEPALLARWHAGDLSKAKCTSCNGCYKAKRYECVIKNASL